MAMIMSIICAYAHASSFIAQNFNNVWYCSLSWAFMMKKVKFMCMLLVRKKMNWKRGNEKPKKMWACFIHKVASNVVSNSLSTNYHLLRECSERSGYRDMAFVSSLMMQFNLSL